MSTAPSVDLACIQMGLPVADQLINRLHGATRTGSIRIPLQRLDTASPTGTDTSVLWFETASLSASAVTTSAYRVAESARRLAIFAGTSCSPEQLDRLLEVCEITRGAMPTLAPTQAMGTVYCSAAQIASGGEFSVIKNARNQWLWVGLAAQQTAADLHAWLMPDLPVVDAQPPPALAPQPSAPTPAARPAPLLVSGTAPTWTPQDLIASAQTAGAPEIRPVLRADTSVPSAGLPQAPNASPTHCGGGLQLLETGLTMAMDLAGALACALVDYRDGSALITRTTGKAIGINLQAAAQGNSEVVRAKLETMNRLKLDDDIEDMLISLNSQYHVIRVMAHQPGLFIYLVLDRSQSNLALARLRLAEIDQFLKTTAG